MLIIFLTNTGEEKLQETQPILKHSYESIHSPHKRYEPCHVPGTVGAAENRNAVQGRNQGSSWSPLLPSFTLPIVYEFIFFFLLWKIDTP